MASTQAALKDLEGSGGEASLSAVPQGPFGKQRTCASDAQPAGLFYVLTPHPDRRLALS
jgi:hypothetical protein